MKVTASSFVVGGALVLYAASLALPAFECGGDRPFLRFARSDDPLGILIFGFGWLGLMVGEFRWFANLPFLFMVLQMLAKPGWTKRFVYPLLVAPIALSCLFVPAMACGNNYELSKSLGIGGYLWVVSVLSVSVIYTMQLLNKPERLSAS